MNQLDLSLFVVVASDNPKYYYELYSKDTFLFVCYYFHRTHEGKSLDKKSMVKMRRILHGF
jgi:hypothetical protein